MTDARPKEYRMTQVSLSFIVGLIVAGLITVAGIVVTVLGVRWWRRERADRSYSETEFAAVTTIAGIVAVVVTLGISAWVFFPYSMEYHQFRHVEGNVQDVQSRFLGDGKSTSQNYAVRLTEDGQTYRCDDSRCSLLKPGDHISLWCIREWQYASTSGYRCRFEDAS
jgi:heme/copper-type cytochrome/quinol oxidase subunit 2